MERKNPKVGVVTFHNGSNYGAVLQSYALQQVLRDIGCDAYIINYSNAFISKGLSRIRLDLSLAGIFFFIWDLIHFYSNGIKTAKFRRFFSERYQLTRPFNSKELKQSLLCFDIGISGGDQIWNPLLNNGIDDIYYLQFGKFDRKLSYGSSLGSYQYDLPKVNSRIRDLLADYNKIAIREGSSKLEEIIGKKVYEVCDPTLLLDRQKWGDSFKLSQSEKKFLLVYALSDFERVLNIGRSIANSKHLSIFCIGKQLKTYHDVKYVLDAGPEDFVNLFYNASYIVTNSFHGTAFSVNFQKQFVSVRHKKSPERAEAFLHRVGLSKRLIDLDSFTDVIPDITKEEYSCSCVKMEQYRKESFSYLKDACLNED